MIFGLILVFSIAVHLQRGGYGPIAPFLALGFLFWVYRVIAGSRMEEMRDGFFSRMIVWLPAIFVSCQIVDPQLPGVGADDLLRYRMWHVPVLLAQVGIALLGRRFESFKIIVLQSGIFLVLYGYALKLLPNPAIDVFRSNDLAVQYLLAGSNPYSGSYPDIYQGAYDYTPGFLYWPVTLYLQAFSKLVFGDIRAILVLLWWMVPFWYARIRRTHEVSDLAGVWWSLPFLNFGFQQAWIDPLLLCFGGCALALASRGGGWIAPVVLAFAAGAKQYGGVLAFFYPFFLLRRERLREVARRMLVAGVVFVLLLAPFLIWNFHDFWTMTVESHMQAQVRRDALNFSSFWWRITGAPPSPLAQLGAVVLGLGLSIAHVWKNATKRGLRVVPEASAITFGFSMFFGKFAFCNYYWFLIGLWLLAEFIGQTGKTGDA